MAGGFSLIFKSKPPVKPVSVRHEISLCHETSRHFESIPFEFQNHQTLFHPFYLLGKMLFNR
jgi:hypothetical protein